jgi:uncharacterized protein YlxW (UPF0749 family)
LEESSYLFEHSSKVFETCSHFSDDSSETSDKAYVLMPAPKGNTIPDLHVGNMLKAKHKAQRITHAVLARRLKRDQNAIQRLFKRSSIQTYLVWELSIALNHNFFADLAQQVAEALEATDRRDPEEAAERRVTLSGVEVSNQTEIEQLKTEIERLTQERDYLRKAVDGLTRNS